MKKLIVLRRFSQLLFLGLFIYILWSTTYPLNGLLPAETFFKTNPLTMIFTSISERIAIPGIMYALAMLLLALLLGRYFCGWVCPLGSMIDAAGALRKRRPVLADLSNAIMRKPKFAILAIIAVLSIFGMQAAWVFDPIVIMARFVSLNLIPTVTLIADNAFISVLTDHNIEPLFDLYRGLKSSILGIKVYYFDNSLFIFLFFLAAAGSAMFISRLWCRAVCPLGALYSIIAKGSLVERDINGCTHCLKCKSICRMGAIKDDISYVKGECILCMDCVYECPGNITSFKIAPRKQDTANKLQPISRKDFIFLLFSSFFLLGFGKKGSIPGNVIRPPGSLREDMFSNRCIRCGNCMKVCITNGLQPIMLQAGLAALWTPQLVCEIGYCEYNCTLCGNVCPTGAIPKLQVDKKRKTRLGLAQIDRSLCIPWAYNSDCIVCQEHCPVGQKAIKLDEYVAANGKKIYRPRVDDKLCIGCGICQNKCPVRPVRAIRVNPGQSDRG